VRAYRLSSDILTGWTVKQFSQKYLQLKVLNVLRPEAARREPVPGLQAAYAFQQESVALAAAGVSGTTRLPAGGTPAPLAFGRGMLPETTYMKLGAGDDVSFRLGDIITIGGRLEDLAKSVGLIGPEVCDPKALNVPIQAAEILVNGGSSRAGS
jgi:hypothetical protein